MPENIAVKWLKKKKKEQTHHVWLKLFSMFITWYKFLSQALLNWTLGIALQSPLHNWKLTCNYFHEIRKEDGMNFHNSLMDFNSWFGKQAFTDFLVYQWTSLQSTIISKYVRYIQIEN